MLIARWKRESKMEDLRFNVEGGGVKDEGWEFKVYDLEEAFSLFIFNYSFFISNVLLGGRKHLL